MLLDSEDGILARVRELDEHALATVFDMYHEPLYRYAYFHLQDSHRAEEVAGESFSRLLAELHARRGPTRNLRAWLYRVAHNLVIDQLRAQSRLQVEELVEGTAAAGSDVEALIDEVLMAEEMYDALQELTTKQRAVVVLRYLAELSNADVAEILSLPIGAVKSLRNRAIVALRRHLEERQSMVTKKELA